MTEQEALDFYEDYVKSNPQFNQVKWERCEFEEYRNCLSKFLKYPQGHRWKFPEWFDIQDVAFKILVDKRKITEEENKFYCLRFKI